MANPIMYVNKKSSALTVGSYSVPANTVFTYDWDDYKLSIGGSGINNPLGTVSTGAINTHLSNGTIELLFSPNNAIEAETGNAAYWDGSSVDPGYWESLMGYSFKLRRPVQVFKGTEYQFTLPGEANIIVNGQGYVGASYRQRVAITGIEVSVYQHSKITGNFPENVYGSLYKLTGGQWWADTGAGVYSTRSTIAVDA